MNIHLCYAFFKTIAAKVFPGTLSLTSIFIEGMDNRESSLFQETAGPIEKGVRDEFPF